MKQRRRKIKKKKKKSFREKIFLVWKRIINKKKNRVVGGIEKGRNNFMPKYAIPSKIMCNKS